MNNKNIFTENLSHYMKKKGKSRQEICRGIIRNFLSIKMFSGKQKHTEISVLFILL